MWRVNDIPMNQITDEAVLAKQLMTKQGNEYYLKPIEIKIKNVSIDFCFYMLMRFSPQKKKSGIIRYSNLWTFSHRPREIRQAWKKVRFEN